MTIAAALMIQGTSSSAGKSLLVSGLCRLLLREGYSVAPFKAQNMSNNAFVTLEGHEIGRAQAVQAQAARVLPHVDMNPVLLKPEADAQSQVVLMGRPYGRLAAAEYEDAKRTIWDHVTGALDRLRAEYDVVVIEGAGSPAEINLKDRDIANMRIALYANAPVIIVGDIDRGGVFAHLFGTVALLDEEERQLVKGFVINRFRGDPALLGSALSDIERLTGVAVLGVVPWIYDHGIPEEDAVAIERRSDQPGRFEGIDVAVIRFPRIANFDDFDPLEDEPDVRVRYVDRPQMLGEPDLIVLPGTKSTIADLAWMRRDGLDVAVHDARLRGASVLGICGGYQMLGRRIDDQDGVESSTCLAEGLGLLSVDTQFKSEKVTRQVQAAMTSGAGLFEHLNGACVTGYEIHAGITSASDGHVALRRSGDSVGLGTVSADGWTFGCYLHGLFANTEWRQTILSNLARRRGRQFRPHLAASQDERFDRLADVLAQSLDVPAILTLLRSQAG